MYQMKIAVFQLCTEIYQINLNLVQVTLYHLQRNFDYWIARLFNK